jgi:hypothetical protein
MWGGDMEVGKGARRRVITPASDPLEPWFRIVLYVSTGISVARHVSNPAEP